MNGILNTLREPCYRYLCSDGAIFVFFLPEPGSAYTLPIRQPGSLSLPVPPEFRERETLGMSLAHTTLDSVGGLDVTRPRVPQNAYTISTSVLLARPTIGFTTTSESLSKLQLFVGYYCIQRIKQLTPKRHLRNQKVIITRTRSPRTQLAQQARKIHFLTFYSNTFNS